MKLGQINKVNLRNKWQSENEELRTDIDRFNSVQSANEERFESSTMWLANLVELGYKGEEVKLFTQILKAKIEEKKTYAPSPEPKYIEEMPADTALRELDAKILDASEINTKAQAYKDYMDYKAQTEAAKSEAEEADVAVGKIEAERKTMISNCKFPKGVSFDADGVTIDGLPLNRDQVSSSILYKTALRIGAMNLGEVKTLYFDASYYDKNSMEEIQTWAEGEGLQLLIERPDWDGGEIKYELIENKPQEAPKTAQ